MAIDSRSQPVDTSAAVPITATTSAKLDVLRASAVVTVVVMHVGFGNRALGMTCHVGVLSFLVDSALALMFSLERHERTTDGRRLLSTYMVRRVFRIYQLAMIVVGAVYLFRVPAWVTGSGAVVPADTDLVGLASNMLLVQDAVVTRGVAGALMGVLWTLPVELRMCLALPYAYAFVRRVTDLRLLFAVWAASAFIGLAAHRAEMLLFDGPMVTLPWVWVMFPRIMEFMPCFLAGVLAYVLWGRPHVSAPFVALPTVIMLAVAIYYLLAREDPAGRVLAIFGMLVCLSVGLVLPISREPRSRVVRAVCSTVARYSYGIYLLHVPCLWIAFDALAAWTRCCGVRSSPA